MPIDLLRVLVGRNYRRQCSHIDQSVAAGDIEPRQRHHVAQECCQVVALHLGDMVGLGSGEQHLVNARAPQQPRNDAAMSIAEALEDRVDGAPRILKHFAAGQERAKNVHEHDLPGIVAEVLVIKCIDDFRLVGFKAPLHQGGERPIGRAFDTVGNIERGEPHIGILRERPRIEEAAGLQKAKSMLVACRPQVLPIKIMRPLGIVLARRCVMVMIGQKGDEIACRAGAHPAAAKL